MLNHPSEVEFRFKVGFFAIRQKASCFDRVWSYMATETTIIKNSKNNDGNVCLIFYFKHVDTLSIRRNNRSLVLT